MSSSEPSKEGPKEGSGESASPVPAAAAPVFGAAFTFGAPGASGFGAAAGTTTFGGFGAKAAAGALQREP